MVFGQEKTSLVLIDLPNPPERRALETAINFIIIKTSFLIGHKSPLLGNSLTTAGSNIGVSIRGQNLKVYI